LAAAVARLSRPSDPETPQQPTEPTIVTLPAAQAPRLRRLLVSLDLMAAAGAWGLAVAIGSTEGRTHSAVRGLAIVVVLSLVTVLAATARRLYRAQVCSIRAIEIQRVGHVVLLAAAAAWIAGPKLGLRLSPREVLVGCLATFVLVNGFRSGYRCWLATGRRQGRFQRQVVIVGSGAEAAEAFHLVDEHPQLGLDIVGHIGDEAATGVPHERAPHLGPVSATEALVLASRATGVLILPGAFSSPELNRVTRNLLQAGVHVHLASGLSGFAAHRVRPQLLGHESVLYLEPLRPVPWQLAAKRALDLVLGTVIGLLSLPLVAVAAVAIKLHDGGPVIFRQTRVGRGGEHFTIFKLRTMVPDAEARYAELAPALAARTGPLVKLHRDPRVTRVGRILRATSIDELPQILNVLGGSMSLVGPRPNLLVEADRLDPSFLAHKCQVRPGISGLWQVEARDHPSFNVYRRLDVFYMENWSIGLDLAILLATTHRVVVRAVRLLLDHSAGRVPRSVEVRGSDLR